eukprot:scpid67535/ scgid6900/ JmjC domain-containing protein 8; Jumonji domain-containing protein 8
MDSGESHTSVARPRKVRSSPKKQSVERPETSVSRSSAHHLSQPQNAATGERRSVCPTPKVATLVLLGSCAAILLLLQWSSRGYYSYSNSPRARQSRTTVDAGGWNVPDRKTVVNIGTNRCTIDRLWPDQITTKLFEEKYQYRRPLILRFRDGSDGWTDSKRWTRKELLRVYGKQIVGSGRSEDIVKDGGSGTNLSTLTKFVETLMEKPDASGEPLYVFDRDFVPESDLLDSLHMPEFLKPDVKLHDSFLFLGSSKSGVTFHRHADAWNGVVFGLKRWFIYPPELTPPGGVWPGFSQLGWLRLVYPNLTEDKLPMECVQRPGEVLYLPESFYHGTLNIGDTVAIGVQSVEAQTEYEGLGYALNEFEKAAGSDKQSIWNERVKVYQTLLKQTPTNSQLLLALGETLNAQGEVDKGLQMIKEATQIDPFFVQAWANLATALMQESRLDEAEAAFKGALKANPVNVDVLMDYSEFLWLNKRDDRTSMEETLRFVTTIHEKQPSSESRAFLKRLKTHVKSLHNT